MFGLTNSTTIRKITPGSYMPCAQAKHASVEYLKSITPSIKVLVLGAI